MPQIRQPFELDWDRPRQLIVIQPQVGEGGQLGQQRRYGAGQLVAAERQLPQGGQFAQRGGDGPGQLVAVQPQVGEGGQVPPVTHGGGDGPGQLVAVQQQMGEGGQVLQRGGNGSGDAAPLRRPAAVVAPQRHLGHPPVADRHPRPRIYAPRAPGTEGVVGGQEGVFGNGRPVVAGRYQPSAVGGQSGVGAGVGHEGSVGATRRRQVGESPGNGEVPGGCGGGDRDGGDRTGQPVAGQVQRGQPGQIRRTEVVGAGQPVAADIQHRQGRQVAQTNRPGSGQGVVRQVQQGKFRHPAQRLRDGTGQGVAAQIQVGHAAQQAQTVGDRPPQPVAAQIQNGQAGQVAQPGGYGAGQVVAGQIQMSEGGQLAEPLRDFPGQPVAGQVHVGEGGQAAPAVRDGAGQPVAGQVQAGQFDQPADLPRGRPLQIVAPQIQNGQTGQAAQRGGEAPGDAGPGPAGQRQPGHPPPGGAHPAPGVDSADAPGAQRVADGQVGVAGNRAPPPVQFDEDAAVGRQSGVGSGAGHEGSVPAMGGVQGGQLFHYVHCCAGDRISGQGSVDGDGLRFPVDGVGVDGQPEGTRPPHLAGGDGHLESGGGSGVIIRPGGAVPHRHGHRNRLRQRDGAFREGGGDGDGSGGASFHNRLRIDAEGYGGGNGVGVGEGKTGVGDGETGGRPRHGYRLRTLPGHIIIGPRQTERVGTAGPARRNGKREIIHRRIVGSFAGSVVGFAHRHGHLRIGGQNGRPRRESGRHRHHRRTVAFRQGGGTRAEADGLRGGVAVG